MGSLSLFQGIFTTQGLNPGLPHCKQILYQLSHKGNPWILEWVAYPFSSGSSWPRNRTGVSCIAGGFFTNWAIRKTHIACLKKKKKTSVSLKQKCQIWSIFGTKFYSCNEVLWCTFCILISVLKLWRGKLHLQKMLDFLFWVIK